MRIILGKLHIQISWFRQSNTKRYLKWRKRAKKKGLCVQCSKPINEINEKTKKLYAKCKRCRKSESLAQRRRLEAKKRGLLHRKIINIP